MMSLSFLTDNMDVKVPREISKYPLAVMGWT